MSDTTNTEVQFDNTDDLDAFTADFFGQKQATDTEAKVEEKPAEQDTEVEDKTEVTEDQNTDPNDDPDKEYVETPPKKKTVQDRIDELVRQREEAKREAAEQVAQLRREMEELKKGVKPVEVDPPKVGEPQPTDLLEDGTAKYELGEFDPSYIRDLTRYTLNQERERLQAEQAEQVRQRETQQAQMQMQTEWNSKVEAAKTAYPDLVEKGQAMLANFNNLPENYAAYLSQVIMSMDKGPDVLYYLSNNLEEVISIVNSGAQKATLALGRIEAKFLEADAQKQLAKPKISQAPVPPPVRTRGTNGAFISVASDTDDLDAFQAEFFRKK